MAEQMDLMKLINSVQETEANRRKAIEMIRAGLAVLEGQGEGLTMMPTSRIRRGYVEMALKAWEAKGPLGPADTVRAIHEVLGEKVERPALERAFWVELRKGENCRIERVADGLYAAKGWAKAHKGSKKSA